MTTDIEQQLTELFELEAQLNRLLDEQEYEQFQLQQTVFSTQIRALLENNSTEALNDVVEQLKTLKSSVAKLQSKSVQTFKQLKEQSLQQKRNKKKIKAYK